MGKVVGLGGVFLHFKGHKEEIQDWYEKFLKCDMSAYGTGFSSGEQLMLVSFKREEDQAIINFRVEGLKELIKEISENGGKLLSNEETPYGDFATIMDPFDNKVELWQANEATYKAMVKEEILDYQKNK